VRDEERPGQPKKFEDFVLQELLDESPVQTLLELSKALNVTPKAFPKRLHTMGKIHKKGIWLPYELSENAILNRLPIATSLFVRQKKQSFLRRIVTGNKKWIYFDNPKRKKSWMDPG